MKIAGIIPARYASSRFPGKPLALIQGKPMILHTLEKVLQSEILSDVLVATDDIRIQQTVEEAGGKCIMTDQALTSGTERCAAAIAKTGKNWDAVINIQGDEPLIHHEHIQKIANLLENGAPIATLAKQMTNDDSVDNPNIVKIIFNKQQQAIYFSRHPIPYIRQQPQKTTPTVFYKHIGIYGYQTSILTELVKLSPTMLEQAEQLEQLRWIEHGYPIYTAKTQVESISIDTPKDLRDLEKYQKHL
ncbi:MAG: 3-deoxy-manno-octulosonate cytidylyltransferase [Bacteroidales bacterium]